MADLKGIIEKAKKAAAEGGTGQEAQSTPVEPIDIKLEMAQIRMIYKTMLEKRGFNAMIYGDKGSGKTEMLATGRRPVHIDSFDPGGTKSILRHIKAGYVLADTRWEDDDPDSPHVFMEWLAEMSRRKKGGYFNYIGTYALDSATMFQKSSMHRVLKAQHRKDWIPVSGKIDDNDYVKAQVPVERAIELILNLPCDCILTAHSDMREEEGTKRKFIGPFLSGQLAIRLPLLFDELYYLKVEQGAQGPIRTVVTATDGLFRASSRLSQRGLLAQFEEPDIKKILRKVGYPTDDKVE